MGKNRYSLSLRWKRKEVHRENNGGGGAEEIWNMPGEVEKKVKKVPQSKREGNKLGSNSFSTHLAELKQIYCC